MALCIQDNVLLEWTLILELEAAGRLFSVFPILIGELLFEPSAGTAGGCLEELEMGSLFASQAYQNLSTEVHTEVNARAQALLVEHGITPTPRLHSRTVREVVSGIAAFLGLAAQDSFNTAVAAAARRGGWDREREHCKEAGMRALVRTARKELTRVLDSLNNDDNALCSSQQLVPVVTNDTSQPAKISGEEALTLPAGADAQCRRSTTETEKLHLKFVGAGAVSVGNEQAKGDVTTPYLRIAAAERKSDGSALGAVDDGQAKMEVSTREAVEGESLVVIEGLRAHSAADKAAALAAEEKAALVVAEIEKLRLQAAMAQAAVVQVTATAAAAEEKAAAAARIAAAEIEALRAQALVAIVEVQAAAAAGEAQPATKTEVTVEVGKMESKAQRCCTVS